jgi:hypothetical protein
VKKWCALILCGTYDGWQCKCKFILSFETCNMIGMTWLGPQNTVYLSKWIECSLESCLPSFLPPLAPIMKPQTNIYQELLVNPAKCPLATRHISLTPPYQAATRESWLTQPPATWFYWFPEPLSANYQGCWDKPSQYPYAARDSWLIQPLIQELPATLS